MKNITNFVLMILVGFFISLSYRIIKSNIITKAIINYLAYEYYFCHYKPLGGELVQGF